MYVQYSQGFPGVVVDDEAGKIYVDTSGDLTQPLAEFYDAYLKNDTEPFAMTPDVSSGLHAFLSLKDPSPRAVKGQVVGPVTWGLMVVDEKGKAVLYDDTLGDVLPRFLKLKAAWQEKVLSRLCRNTIMFIDEPYMASFGSSYVAVSEEKVISLLEEVFSGLSGIKGIHCCGNTDWSVLLKTSTDIISFDTYEFAGSLALYPAEVNKFLARGGAIAWGIVPNEVETLAKETVASLKDRLEEAITPFTKDGTPFREILSHSLLTPACGLARLGSEEAAEQALEILSELSTAMRKLYL